MRKDVDESNVKMHRCDSNLLFFVSSIEFVLINVYVIMVVYVYEVGIFYTY